MSDISPGNLNHNAHQAWQKIMGGWRGGNGLYADVTIYRRANIFISYRASYLFFIFNINPVQTFILLPSYGRPVFMVEQVRNNL
ncbi:hypothetical protein C7M52_01545 [Mixta theicola]|nr:hypothetical protein [Mixta theicola]QHM75591.1 hypothetical protein C7M52_01545 [Mixta theicola]